MEDLQQAVPVLDKQSLKEDCKKLSRLHFEDETFAETLDRLSHVVHPMLKRGERQYLNWGGVMSHIKNSNNFIENIFSVKNYRENARKYKIITVLGIKFRI